MSETLADRGIHMAARLARRDCCPDPLRSDLDCLYGDAATLMRQLSDQVRELSKRVDESAPGVAPVPDLSAAELRASPALAKAVADAGETVADAVCLAAGGLLRPLRERAALVAWGALVTHYAGEREHHADTQALAREARQLAEAFVAELEKPTGA